MKNQEHNKRECNKDEIYNRLVERPIISGDIRFVFETKDSPQTVSDLRDLIITDNRANRLMLLDYIVHDDCRLRIKMETVDEKSRLKINVKGIDPIIELMGSYLFLELDTFLSLTELGRFSVEVD